MENNIYVERDVNENNYIYFAVVMMDYRFTLLS